MGRLSDDYDTRGQVTERRLGVASALPGGPGLRAPRLGGVRRW